MFTPSLFKTALCAFLALGHLGAVDAAAYNLLGARQGATNVQAREYKTNGERMRAGFPPLAPRSLFPTAASPARRAAVSQLPTTTQCIKVTRKSTGNVIGYISSDYASGSGYFETSASVSKCLQVLVPGVTTGKFDLKINEVSSMNYLGLATGIGSSYALPVRAVQGSALIAGMNSNFGSTPLSESTVWSLSGATLASTLMDTGGTLRPITTYMRSSAATTTVYFAYGSGFTSAFNNEFEVELSLLAV